jgi:hypothetical protein
MIPISIIDGMSASVFSKVNISGYNPNMVGDPEVLIAAKGKVNSGALPKWFLTFVRYSFSTAYHIQLRLILPCPFPVYITSILVSQSAFIILMLGFSLPSLISYSKHACIHQTHPC